jgi:hypothetical protein
MANILAVPGPNSKYQLHRAPPAGFWAGVWHGLISPITFVASLFTPNVRIYEANNRGRLYDLGFLLGAGASIGTSGSEVRAGDWGSI